MPASPRSSWRYDLGLLMVVLIWGFNFPITKAVFAVMPPLVFNAVRFTLTVGFMGLLTWREAAPVLDFRWRSKQGGVLFLLGILGHFIYQMGFILGLYFTTAGNAALLIATAPLWTALIGHLTGVETLRRLTWLGLALAFAGAAQLTLSKSGVQLGDETLWGDLLCLGGAVAWGGFTTWSKPFLRTFTPTAYTFWTALVALPFLWAAALPSWEWDLMLNLNLAAWAAICYSGLLSSGIAYLLWNLGVKHVGAAQTAVYGNLVSVVALVSSVLLLDEILTSAQLVAVALILSGLFVMRRART